MLNSISNQTSNSSSRTIKTRKQHWIDFLNMKSDARFTINVKIENDEELPARPIPNPENNQLRIDWAMRKYNLMMERLNYINDDRIPHLDVYTGTEIFAEALGCKVHRSDDNMPFALSMITEASEVSKIKVPELSSSKLAVLFEMADKLRKEAGNDAIVKLVDIQSPMDISALIWDKSTFYIALLEEPWAVKELAAKVNQLLTSFLDEWFKRYGKEYIAHYPEYYMLGGVTLSEDEVGVISAPMFEKLFLPELEEISIRYGGLGMHCCANSIHQWNGFKKIPNLKLINLNQPSEVLTKAYDYFSNHCAQMHSWCGDGDPVEWIKKYPKNSHVVLQPTVKSKFEAITLCERLREVCETCKE